MWVPDPSHWLNLVKVCRLYQMRASGVALVAKYEFGGNSGGVGVVALDTMSAAEGSPLVPRRFPEGPRRSPKVPDGSPEVPKGSPKFPEGSAKVPKISKPS